MLFMVLIEWIVHCMMLCISQVTPNAFDIFESVRSQVRLPSSYTAQNMQADMVTYMKRNKDELEVFVITVTNIIVCK